MHSARMKTENPNSNGQLKKIITFLLDEHTKDVMYTFNSLKEAESTMASMLNQIINHTSVHYNRKRSRPYKGYYWCVGKKELESLRGPQ